MRWPRKTSWTSKSPTGSSPEPDALKPRGERGTLPYTVSMQCYLVGGAVRDTLLGLEVKDRDWVVVGATPQQMVDQGYLPVGRDFPVFLHPRTREEYALARTERKSAPGYRGFVIHAAPDVTLEQDLARRDLTINAMAVAEQHLHADGTFDAATTPLNDPWHGQRDLQAGVLRHVTDAFRDDPVRILRVARFAARFDRFTVADDTLQLMRDMVQHGEADALVAERVWQEVARGLMEPQPVRMLRVLADCAALAPLLPELHLGNTETEAWRHVAQRLDAAAAAQAVVAVRFACLCLPMAPSAGASLATTVQALEALCHRLRVPGDCRELLLLASREQAAIHGSAALDPAQLVTLLERCDALRKPQRFANLLLAMQCDAVADTGAASAVYPQRQRLLAALAAAQAIAADTIAKEAMARGLQGPAIGELLHQARVVAVATALGWHAAPD